MFALHFGAEETADGTASPRSAVPLAAPAAAASVPPHAPPNTRESLPSHVECQLAAVTTSTDRSDSPAGDQLMEGKDRGEGVVTVTLTAFSGFTSKYCPKGQSLRVPGY